MTLEYKMLYRIPIVPRPAPRQGRADRWGTSARTLLYHQFKDDLRAKAQAMGFKSPEELIPENAWLIFRIPIPRGVKGKKRADRVGQPHQQTPDIDNLEKAVLDCFFSKKNPVLEDYGNRGDQHIWDLRGTKVWTEPSETGEGWIEVWSIPSYQEIMALMGDFVPGQTLKLVPIGLGEAKIEPESEDRNGTRPA